MNNESPEQPRTLIQVPLSEEELAAVEGWRIANKFSSREAAVRKLVRLGLLSEIGRLYQSVTNMKESSD